MAVFVDVPETRGFDTAGLVDFVARPLTGGASIARIFSPDQRLSKPAAADNIEPSVTVDIHRVVVERIAIATLCRMALTFL